MPRMNKRFKGAAAAALAGVMVLGMSACANRNGSHADEEGFPTGTITFYTPTSAGGATDLTARTLATQLEDDLGVSVVVDNRPGGAGSVGMEHVGKQAADGYTIAVFPVEVAMLGHLGYSTDPADYEFLGQVNSQPGTIAVPASSPYETLDDLIVAAAAAPHTITVSNAGPGSIWEAGAVALGEAAGVTFQGVPFDGGAPAVTAAIGSQVDAVVAGIGETAPAHQDGRLRVLATFTEERTPALPDVPTATEQGADVVIGSWAVIASPAGLPASVAERLEAAIAAAVQTEEYISLIESGGNIPLHRGAAEATAFVSAEWDRFAAILGR